MPHLNPYRNRQRSRKAEKPKHKRTTNMHGFYFEYRYLFGDGIATCHHSPNHIHYHHFIASHQNFKLSNSFTDRFWFLCHPLFLLLFSGRNFFFFFFVRLHHHGLLTWFQAERWMNKVCFMQKTEIKKNK